MTYLEKAEAIVEQYLEQLGERKAELKGNNAGLHYEALAKVFAKEFGSYQARLHDSIRNLRFAQFQALNLIVNLALEPREFILSVAFLCQSLGSIKFEQESVIEVLF